MKNNTWILIVIVAAAFATGLWVYPQLPPTIISHWDASGHPNGTMGRALGLFIFPIIIALLALIFSIIPRIDPKRENIQKFRKHYDYFVVGIMAFFFWVYILFILQNLGYSFDFSIVIIPPLSALFWIVGAFLPYTKPNWFIGIRTPWTISNEKVWEKTHRAAGPVFKIAAVAGLIGIFFPPYGISILVAAVIVAAIGLVIYSYVLYEEERK